MQLFDFIFEHISLVSDKHGMILLTTQIEKDAPDHLHRNASGTFGDIAIEEISCKGYSFWQARFKLTEEMLLSTVLPTYCGLLCVLQTDIAFTVDDEPIGTFLQNQFGMLVFPPALVEFHMLPHREYVFFGVHLDKKRQAEWRTAHYPVPSFLNTAVEPELPFIFQQGTLTGEMLRLIDSIFAWHDHHERTRNFQKTRINDLLLDISQQPGNAVPITRPPGLNPDDERNLVRLYNYLVSSPHNIQTLPELAKEFSLNLHKLKEGFKFEFHFTVERFRTGLRLRNAYRLLKGKDLMIYKIAEMAGYSDTSFTTAIRNRYKCSPIGLRTRLHQRRAL